MKKNSVRANDFASLQKSRNSVTYAPLSKSVCAAMLAGAMVLGGGVFVSPAPAYADGYVSPDGNNIYYGYKSDANYSKDRFKIEVHYYSSKEDAENDAIAKQDPLGQYVHVKYIANLDNNGTTFDKWAFRPMWWYGVPKGLEDVHNINYGRYEQLTQNPYSQASTPGIKKDTDQVKKYNTPDDWKSISNFYVKPDQISGVKKLVGVTSTGADGNKYDNQGNTAGNWADYLNASKGMQNIFIDWESSGTRYYVMTYVAKMTDDAWKKRDEHPLRFAAGVYRIAGNWHIATAQTHRAPKIADSLKVKYPKRTAVENTNSLKDGEKTKVKTAITNANADTPHFSDLLDGTAGIEVGENGTAKLTFKDNTTLTMPGKLLVMEQKRDRDLYPPTYPAPVPAVDPDKPNAEEQKAIIKAIKDANTSNKNFTDHVDLDGTGTFTFDDSGKQLKIKYKDNSKLTIPYNQLVYQGATIADWAPYVVPDYTEVGNLTAITSQEITSIKTKFDTANKDLDVYTKAKAKNKDDYLTINASTGDATIKWEDGSKTVIGAWQFLKEAKKAPAPEPSTPVTKKEFKLKGNISIVSVNFNPFNMKKKDITDNNRALSSASLTKYVVDSETGQAVAGTSVMYDVDSAGAGTVTFKADGYNDKTYPMSMFFQQRVDNQKPAPDTTLHHPGNMTAYKYYVDPVQVDNVNSPSAPDQLAAFKKFMKKNYNVDVTDQEAMSAYTLKENDKPVTGVENMQRYVQGQHNGAGVVSFSLNQDGSIAVQGFETGENSSKKLFDVPLKDLYVAKTQQHTDNTFDQLKAQALALWNQKKNTDRLTDRDFKRVGITDPSKYPADINSMTDTTENKAALRKLIQQLYEAKKITRKYNNPSSVEVKDTTNPTDEDFKKAIKAFLDANYTGVGEVSNTTYSMTSALKPKSSTADMEPYDVTKNPVGITTISKGTGNKLTVACKDGTSFTVDITFKKKQDTPSAEDLKKLKEQAKELINRNPKLTEEQKTEYKQKIEKATTKEQIQNILKEANKKGNDNNVNANDLKEKEKKEKKKREEEKRKEEEKKQLQKDKDKAKETLNTLTKLTDGDSGDKKKLSDEIDKAQTPEEVKKILEKAKAINDARGALKEGALPFLSHGKSDSNDDKALKELIGADITKKDETLTALETAIKDISNAQTSAIRAALDAATRKNGINEQAARQAANAKIAEFENKLEAAEKVLTDNKTIKDDDKTKATNAINDAKTAIGTAKTQVASATTPSGMLTQLTGVETKFNTANSKVNDAVNNAQKDNKQHNTNDPDATTFQSEKDKAKGDIDKITDLTPAEKQKYKDEIDHSTHKGDPEAIVNRASKNKKIKDALAAIEKLEHLNNAQKQAYEDIINSTDAYDHIGEDGKSTSKDDIDDALEQAKDTDTAMKFLGDLKKQAEDFKKTAKYTGATVDSGKKSAFDKALQAAEDVLNKKTGAPKSSVEVNKLYNDLLQKMKDLDTNAAGATVTYTALQEEVGKENTVKVSEGYKYSKSTKQNAYTNALSAAKTVLAEAQGDLSKKSLEELQKLQQKVDDALAKLKEAEAALKGHAPTPTPSVDKSHLQQGINGSGDVKKSDDYNNAPSDKKQAYDHALDHANEVNNDPHATQDQVNQAAEDLKKAEHDLKPAPTPSVDKSGLQKEIGNEPNVKKSDDYNNAPSDKKQAYDHALDHANEVNKDPNATQDQVNQAAEDLKKAENDLKPTPTPSVDKSHLQQGINGSDDVHNSDDYTNAPSDKKQAYDHALDHANEVNKDPNATQDQVNQAAEDLKNAQKDLHDSATVDKSHLQSEVSDDVAFRARGSYLVADAPHKDAYNAALSEARRVLADPNATQAQVNAALSKLREAKRNILQANGLSGDEYAGDGNTGTGNTGTGNTGAGNTGTVPGSSVVPGTVPGTVPGSGDSGFGSTGTGNAGTSNTGTTNSGVAGSGHEGDSSLGFGVNDNAPTTVDKGELNLQIQGAESDSQSANAGNAGANNAANAGNAGANNAANAGNAGANNAANAGNAGANNAANAGANNAANAGNAGANAAANNNAAVTAAVENNPAVKQADAQVAAAQAALDSALAEAKKVAADHNATQAQVDAAKRKLADARKNLADAQAHAAQVRASVRAQVLKSGKVAQLSNTGSAVSALSTFAATIAAAGAALFVSKRRGTSRHSSK